MKITMDPKTFKSILESAMFKSSDIGNHHTAFRVTKEGLTIKEKYSNVFAVQILVEPEYFTQYKVDKDEDLVIPDSILDLLKTGFKDGNITLTSNGDMFSVDTQKDHFDRNLVDEDPVSFLYTFKEIEEGLIPATIEPKSSFLLDSKQLDFSDSNIYDIEFKGKELIIYPIDKGNLNRKLEISKVVGDNPIKIRVDGEYLRTAVKHLSGEVLLTLHPNVTAISEVNEKYKKIYVIANMDF